MGYFITGPVIFTDGLQMADKSQTVSVLAMFRLSDDSTGEEIAVPWLG